MPHANASFVPETIQSKVEFWAHVYTQLDLLLTPGSNWVTNLANVSSVIYNSLLAFPHFGMEERKVNWCGFYLDASLFPTPRISQVDPGNGTRMANTLLLGPFCGKPACQFINTMPTKASGVCAHTFLQRRTTLVPNVELFPGHIACDGDTKSEIVCPLILRREDREGEETILGVLDLDCIAIGGFDEEDKEGLEKIVELVVNACAW